MFVSAALTFNVCAEDNQWIYADGTLVGSFTDATRWGVDVLRRKIVEMLGRCADWALPCYDDSKWITPTANPSSTTYCSASGYPASSQWLWIDSTFYSKNNVTIYCRKQLRKFSFGTNNLSVAFTCYSHLKLLVCSFLLFMLL